MVVLTNVGAGVMLGGRKSDVFMEIFRILCLKFAFGGNVLAELDCVAVKCIVAYNTSMARR